jgi:hypothetical protein
MIGTNLGPGFATRLGVLSMLFRISWFVSGKFKGSVIAEGKNKGEAYAKAIDTEMYRRLARLGWMVQWSAEPIKETSNVRGY